MKENRGENIYLNFREPYLSTWHHPAAWTSRDEGSQILFTTEDGILAEAAKKLENEVKAQYPEAKFGDELGLYPKKSLRGHKGYARTVEERTRPVGENSR